MSSLALTVAQAYAENARLGGAGGTEGAGARTEAVGADFGAMLRSSLGEATTIGRDAEAKAAASLTGQAELVDVVTAITAAESTLETIVAVRDRVIAAYQEISRMPI